MNPAGQPISPPNLSEYYSETKCTWCDGCGNYGIWTAVKQALVELQLHPWQVCLCYDIGCHGNASDKLEGYRVHGIHGRVIPFAAGVKLANNGLTVVAFGGDGASFSEGVGHLIHGLRSNYPLTFVLHNNANYGLTTGQASALTWQGQAMNWSPNGIPERTIDSMALIFSLQPTFVARGFTGNIKLMTRILRAAIQHRGFAIVDMLQACPTYNHFATHEYLLERCYDANAEGHVPDDRERAMTLATQTSDRIACGVLYQRNDVPSFYDRLLGRQGCQTTCVDEVQAYDVSKYWKSMV